MSKKAKIIISIVSVVVVLAIVIGSCNIYAAVVGSQEQKGVATGYAWNKQTPYDQQVSQRLDMGQEDYKVLVLTDVHLKNHGTFAAWLGINYLLDAAGKTALDKLVKILQEIERREAECNEDWLVLVTADHGGSGRGHGLQIYEHRTIWVASNRPIDASYYGKNYDGYKENVA